MKVDVFFPDHLPNPPRLVPVPVTWSFWDGKTGRAEWLVRGPRGLTVGWIDVAKRGGGRSRVYLAECVWESRDFDVALYRPRRGSTWPG